MADSSEGLSIQDAPSGAERSKSEYPKPFGNYLLLQRIARGGMGEVFLAKHGGIAGIEKHCVVKTLRPHFTADREYVTRFIDEARVVVQLAHRNIAQIFDVGRVGKQYYLAMEFIVGRDLRTIAERVNAGAGRVPEAIALHIVGEMLEALDYAHRHVDAGTGVPLHLVHRDVSPQNVMVSFEGEVKLIDFGLAHSSMKVEKTQPNVVMGKMAYMSPEQARGDAVDGRADMFAAAVVLYELLFGERFYEGMGFDQIWGLAGSGGHRPRKWDQLAPELARALGKALEASADDRYPSCADFKDALLEYQMSARIRPVGRELRELMGAMFIEESGAHRKLISRYKNVSAIPSGQSAPAPADESQSFAVASVESFIDQAPIPDRAVDVIPLRAHDRTEVAASDATKLQPPGEASVTNPDTEADASPIPEMSTVVQAPPGSQTDPGGGPSDEKVPDRTLVGGAATEPTHVYRPSTAEAASVVAAGSALRSYRRLWIALLGVIFSLVTVVGGLVLAVRVTEPASAASDEPPPAAAPTGAAPGVEPSEGDDEELLAEPAAEDAPLPDEAEEPAEAADDQPAADDEEAPAEQDPTEQAPAEQAPAEQDPAEQADDEEGAALAQERDAKPDEAEADDGKRDKRLSRRRYKKAQRRAARRTSRPARATPTPPRAAPKPKREARLPAKLLHKDVSEASEAAPFLREHCLKIVRCARRYKKPSAVKEMIMAAEGQAEIRAITASIVRCAQRCQKEAAGD